MERDMPRRHGANGGRLDSKTLTAWVRYVLGVRCEIFWMECQGRHDLGFTAAPGQMRARHAGLRWGLQWAPGGAHGRVCRWSGSQTSITVTEVPTEAGDSGG